MKTTVPAVLVGREPELATLREALARARTGVPAAVVVGGEAGIGKSTLIAGWLDEAATEGVLVADAHVAGAMDHALPYGAIAAALRALAQQLSERDRDTVFGPDRDLLAPLVPELDAAAPARREGRWIYGPENQYALDQGRLRLFAAVADALHRAASHGAVLVLEDLHWADGSTLDLVGYLLHGLEGRLLVVASHRTDDLRHSHPLRARLAEWQRLPAVERVELGRLSDDDLYRLLTAGGPQRVGDSLLRDVVERSAGNPFVAQQLLAAGRTGAHPAGLRDAVLARLAALSPDAQTVVRAAAAGGTAVRHDLLEAVVDAADVGLTAGLREAVEAHLLDAHDDGYAFAHALSREVVHEDLLPGERRRLHGRYLAALRARPELADGRVVAQLARHATEAHDHGAALEAWLEAAEEAVDAFAFTEALRHLEEAMAIWGDVPDAETRTGTRLAMLHKKAAHLAVENGEPGRAIRHAETALDLFDPVEDPEPVALTYRSLAHARYRRYDPDAEKAYLEALSILPAEPPSPMRTRVLAWYGMFLSLQGRTAEADEVVPQAYELALGIGHQSDRLLAAVSLAIHHAHHGRFDQAEQLLSDVIAEATDIGEYGRAMHARANLADALAGAGRYDDAIEVALQELSTTGNPAPGQTVFLVLNAVESALILGRYHDAEQWLTGTLGRLPEGTIRLHGHVQLAGLRLGQGQLEAARIAVAAATEIADQGNLGLQYALPVAAIRARLALLDGDPRGALVIAEAALREHPETAGVHRLTGDLQALAAQAAVAASDGPATRRAAERLARIRADGRPRAPLFEVFARVVDAELATGNEPVAAWQRVAGAAAELGARPVAWYAAQRLGEVHLARGEQAEAKAVVLPALEESEAAGAGAIAAALRGLAGRGRLVDTDRSTVQGLTSRELEVLQLVAAGRTNREIGATLYISPKTASVHVSNVLRKLGLTNRAEAAGYAHRHGLAGGEHARRLD